LQRSFERFGVNHHPAAIPKAPIRLQDFVAGTVRVNEGHAANAAAPVKKTLNK
jgi:hypothetical protein